MACRENYLLTILLLFVFFAKIFTALSLEVNWDEFYYLSFIYDYINDRGVNSFQTFHVHFFTWLRWISDNEVKQIITARLIMIILQVFTGFLIFKICRYKFSLTASLFSLLSYFSFSFIISHGASFRTDPIATFFLIISIYYLFFNKESKIKFIISGVFTAASFLITIKSAIYFPVFLFMVLNFIFISKNKIFSIGYLFLYFVSTIIVFFILYTWHSNVIGYFDFYKDSEVITGGAEKTFGHGDIFPSINVFIVSFIENILYWIVFIYGVKNVILLFSKKMLADKYYCFIVSSIICVIFTFLIYRNAYPYFYSFILAPVCILFAFSWDFFFYRERDKTKKFYYFIILLSYFLISIVYDGFIEPYKRSLDYQNKFIETVHEIFPYPVPYIDRCSMIPSFSKKGFFMSSWGVENYLDRGGEVLSYTVEKYAPVFLIINSPFLDFNSEYHSQWSNVLYKNDLKSLKDNYIKHWNELYVAGKVINLNNSIKKVDFNINIAGLYTLESDSLVFIDKELIHPMQTVNLSKGIHQIKTYKNNGEFILRWGNSLYRPEEDIRVVPIFTGF